MSIMLIANIRNAGSVIMEFRVVVSLLSNVAKTVKTFSDPRMFTSEALLFDELTSSHGFCMLYGVQRVMCVYI